MSSTSYNINTKLYNPNFGPMKKSPIANAGDLQVNAGVLITCWSPVNAPVATCRFIN